MDCATRSTRAACNDKANDVMDQTQQRRAGHGKRISYYGFGRTTMFACQFDQRFSYCLYVPASYDEDGDTVYPLAVVVHGTNRPAQEYRDAFVEFAEREQCVIVAPLFPAGIIEPGELSSYKFIKFHDIRFDHVLLAMIDEIAETYRVNRERFLLHGFSGGGHFAHRFFFLHPHRLLGVSIGAPGMVTLLDDRYPWWVGIADLEEQFGITPDLAAMREVAVQMIVGADDTETWEITSRPGTRYWMPDANIAGETRIDRIASLRDSFERHGIRVQLDLVPGVSHQGFKILGHVQEFFADTLAASR
jgi:poly(3-hydroxybutyrate) depolymerase